MNPWEKKKWAVVIGIVLLCVGGSLYFTVPQKLEEPVQREAAQRLQEKEPQPKAIVYISGAVKNPGLYPIETGTRFQEALEKAGGPTEDADLSKVNLAKKCKDGMQLNVPYKKEKKASRQVTVKRDMVKEVSENPAEEVEKKAPMPSGKINLNLASAASLETLPGIGPALARRIIAYRQKTPFARLEDLQKVSGIGPAKFLKLRDFLEV